MSTEPAKTKPEDSAVSDTDILFECPACAKSLVVDEAAEGMIVDCPQCRTNVIVPPKSTKAATPAPTTKEEPEPVEADRPGANAVAVPLQKRIAVLASQLKEIHAQRTEVTGRIASRLNEVNRDLVMIARLETSQQQILSEWNQLVEKISLGKPITDPDPSRPVVVGASVGKTARTRVSFSD